MKVVIDINENVYKYLKQEWVKVPNDDSVINQIMHGILHGTILPEGHGRLIDAETALNLYKPLNVRDELWAETTLAKAINNSPTIIEASKEADNE